MFAQGDFASVLDDAQAIFLRRSRVWGDPAQSMTRIGRLWGALLGTPDIPPEQVSLMMAALKLSRAIGTLPHSAATDGALIDSLTDACAYTALAAAVHPAAPAKDDDQGDPDDPQGLFTLPF